MTNTQVAFWNYREQKRHNLATEKISADTLGETIRHDVQSEKIEGKKAKAALNSAKASLKSSQAALKNAKANLKNAKTNKEKLKWQKKVDQLEIAIKEQQNAIRSYEAKIKQQEANIKQQEVNIKKAKMETEIAKMQAELGKAKADALFTTKKAMYYGAELLLKGGSAGQYLGLLKILGTDIANVNGFAGEVSKAAGDAKSGKEAYDNIEEYAKNHSTFRNNWSKFKKDFHEFAELYTKQSLPWGVSGTP